MKGRKIDRGSTASHSPAAFPPPVQWSEKPKKKSSFSKSDLQHLHNPGVASWSRGLRLRATVLHHVCEFCRQALDVIRPKTGSCSAALPHHHSDVSRLISEGPPAKSTLFCSRREAKRSNNEFKWAAKIQRWENVTRSSGRTCLTQSTVMTCMYNSYQI